MKFRPLHDRVLIEVLDSSEKTAGGIIIPDTAQEKPQEGKVVAIGECGLDYSKLKYDNKKEQESMFRLQIECSNVSGLPFIIHNRNSDEDMERILIDEAKKNKLRGVLHCFSSSERLAMVAIDLGLSISFLSLIHI